MLSWELFNPECSGDPQRVWMGERFYLVLEDVSVVTVE